MYISSLDRLITKPYTYLKLLSINPLWTQTTYIL